MKWAGMVEIKHKDFIDVVPFMSSLWIIAWGSIEKRKPRFPWAHPLWQVLWQGYRIGRVYTNIKIANNTKSNHVMAFFTDHYNAISVDRPPFKTKFGKGS